MFEVSRETYYAGMKMERLSDGSGYFYRRCNCGMGCRVFRYILPSLRFYINYGYRGTGRISFQSRYMGIRGGRF